MKKILSVLALLTGLSVLAGGLWADTRSEEHAALIKIEGAIGPATSQYFERAQQEALDNGAQLIIVQIDTPGGLEGAMRDMIKLILDTPIPVVGWVGPSGSRAASAGTYLMYAMHVATMAPGTNLGSATPVPIGGSMPVPRTPVEEAKDRLDKATRDDEGESAADDTPPSAEAEADTEADHNTGDAMSNKVLNDAVAYIRGLAELRGRNADWAEEAVRVGANLSARDAAEQNVIDLVVRNLDGLMDALDGREIEVDGATVTLATADLAINTIEPDWREQLLSTLTNPTVAYLLMMVGIYGLLLEGYNPGAILPGVVGAISLLLALFAFQMLPVNYVGLGLVALGVALMVAEAFTPTFGVLGLGGLVAFVLGSVFLMDTGIPGYGVDLWLVAGIAIGTAGLMLMSMYLLMRSRRAPVSAGEVLPLDTEVLVVDADGQRGWGTVNGERWMLKSTTPLTIGTPVRVTGAQGLTLLVEPIPPEER